MQSKQSHLKKVAEVELRLIFGLIIIALINVIIFNNLSKGEPQIFTVLNDIGIYVYGICILAIIISALLHLRKLIRAVFLFLLSLLTVNIIFNLFDLIINQRIADNGQIIVLDASMILFSSLGVFAFWYWLIDRDGPLIRELDDKNVKYDLLFPQYQSTIPGWSNWKPEFWDYYVFSFFTSTGFSPADTLPLSLKVKILMMIEASISLIIIGMVISRAISLIQ